MLLRILTHECVIPAPDEQSIGKNGHCKHIRGGHLHLGKGADNGIPKIRNVMKTVIILAQNILHLSVYKL